MSDTVLSWWFVVIVWAAWPWYAPPVRRIKDEYGRYRARELAGSARAASRSSQPVAREPFQEPPAAQDPGGWASRSDKQQATDDLYRPGMPELSRFFGIVIQMYVDDHGPAHFHARHAGMEVAIAIDTLAILRGRLSPRAHALVEWASIHTDDLLADWQLAQAGLPLRRIEPLR